MNYTMSSVNSIAELKLTRGNSSAMFMTTLVNAGNINTVYIWSDSSTATNDDYSVIVPTTGDTSVGRWLISYIGITNMTIQGALGFIPTSLATARTSISLTTTGSGASTYNNTTGVLNIPTPVVDKRRLTFSGTTSGSGTFSGTFSPAFSVAPNIQANIIGGTPNQTVTMTVSTTGFTITANQRNAVTLLAVEVLLAGTVTLNGAVIDVLITEK